MAEKDMTEKTLEAYDDVFADIVNGLLFNGEQVLCEQLLVDAQPFSTYKADGKLHEQERDVSKYCMERTGDLINVRIAFLGIENQSVYDRDMPLRVIGYDGAAYRAQLAAESRYPVITLVLYFGDAPWGKNRTVYDVVDVSDRFKPYVSDYRINLFEIAFLPKEAVDRFHSDFRVMVDYFVSKRDNPNYRPKDPQKFKHVDELLKMMSVLTNDSRFAELLTEEGGRPENMCEVLDRVEEKGRQEGRQEGRREGRKEGIEQTRLESIRNIMDSLALTAQQAMDALKIPVEDRPKYEAKL